MFAVSITILLICISALIGHLGGKTEFVDEGHIITFR